MTEQALLVKSATSLDGRYYAIGLNSPHVRIFDTSRGALCAHIDLAEKMAADKRAGLQSAFNKTVSSTYHDRALELAAVRDISLTAVHITTPAGISKNAGLDANEKLRKGTAGDVEGTSSICLAGFSNGTVMGVRLADDAILFHVAVSDTQQPAIAFASTGDYIFVLCANKQLHVIDANTGARRVVGIPVPANTTTVAVYSSPISKEAGRVDVLLCGTTTLYCTIHVPSHRSFQKMDVVVPTLGGSSAPTSHAFIGSTFANGEGHTNIGITCAASEGVIRVWDLSPSGSTGIIAATGAGAGSRCRRILPCNHRVTSMSVMPERGVISVTTFAGQVLVWNFSSGSAIIAKAGDALAEPATVAITSTSIPSSSANSNKRAQQLHRGVVRGVPTRKILDACLVPQVGDGTNGAASCSLVFVRGKYSLPSFDGTSLATVFTSNLLALDHDEHDTVGGNDPKHHLYLTAPGLTIANSPFGPNLSFNPHEGVVATANGIKASLAAAAAHASSLMNADDLDEDMDEDEEAAAVAQFEIKLGAGWATHSAEAHRAMVTSTEEFSKPTIYQARSMRELPTGGLTAKEADKVLDRVMATTKKGTKLTSSSEDNINKEGEGEAEETPTTKGIAKANKDLGALGLAVVPLYQALHANDKSLVMELITLSSRSQADIVATVRKLAFPYVLQLFSILSERLISVNQIDHPFHSWVAAILQARGVEMMSARPNQIQNCSHPKQFIAPLRQNYTEMLDTQDRLSVLYGRLSIFNAVKPREALKRNTHATVRKGTVGADPSIFPNCFMETLVPKKAKKRGNKTVADAAKSQFAEMEYVVVRTTAGDIVEAAAQASTVARRQSKIAARREKTKLKRQQEKAELLAAKKEQASSKMDDEADVFDEADENDMLDHLDEMKLDSSDEGSGDDLDNMNLDSDSDLSGEDDGAASEKGSLILEGEEDEEDEDDDSEASSADDADNLLDSEDELVDDELDDEEDSDDEDDDNEDDGPEDSDDDVLDADFNSSSSESEDPADRRDYLDDVEEAIRGEHEAIQRAPKSAINKEKKMRTD